MAYARGFGLNGKSLYTNVTQPKEVWLNFIVDSTNGNGLGIRSPKSNGYVESVFMATTATPGKVGGITNPNPQAGYALITFRNNFVAYLGGFSGQVAPTTSNTTSSLTAGHVYVITVLGTTTLANWQTVGVQAGFVPAIGLSFVATATATITGTGRVGLPGVPVSTTLSLIGDPNQSIANSSIAPNAGARVLVQFSNLVPSGTVSGSAFTNTSVYVPTAPADNTVVGMQFCFDGSSVTIDGL